MYLKGSVIFFFLAQKMLKCRGWCTTLISGCVARFTCYWYTELIKEDPAAVIEDKVQVLEKTPKGNSWLACQSMKC